MIKGITKFVNNTCNHATVVCGPCVATHIKECVIEFCVANLNDIVMDIYRRVLVCIIP